MAIAGQLHAMYEPATQVHFDLQAFPTRQGPPQYFYHPPFELVFLLPLALLPYKVAFLTWAAAGVGFLLFSAWALNPHLGQLRAWSGLPVAVLVLAFFPVAIAISEGQDSLLLLAVIALAFRQFQQKKDFRCGAILSLALFKFQYVIPMVALLGIRHRKQLVFGFGMAGIVLFGFSWILVGTSGLRAYGHLLTHHYPEEAWRMPNLRGFVESLGGPAIFTVGLSVAALVWCALKRPRDETSEFSGAIAFSALVSYHMHFYDLTILLLPLLFLADRSVGEKRWSLALLPLLFYLTPLQPILRDLKLNYLLVVPLLSLLLIDTFGQKHAACIA